MSLECSKIKIDVELMHYNIQDFGTVFLYVTICIIFGTVSIRYHNFHTVHLCSTFPELPIIEE